MPDQTSNGMQCNEFDCLLTDALDGVLTGPDSTGSRPTRGVAGRAGRCSPKLRRAATG